VGPKPQRDAAPNLMFNIGELSKTSQTATVSYLSHSISKQFKSEEKCSLLFVLKKLA
jgi:hypothetical protein